MPALSIWQKHKKELSEKRDAFWDYIALLGHIVDSKSYLEEYETAEAFIKDEASFSKTHFYDLVKLCQTRQRLSAIADSPPERINHLKEINKVPEQKQTEVFATTLERCEQEGREPTAKDFKKTAKEIVTDAEWEYVEQDESIPLKEGEIDCGPVENGQPDWKHYRAKARKTAEALLRAVDELDDHKPSDQHKYTIEKISEILEDLDGWK